MSLFGRKATKEKKERDRAIIPTPLRSLVTQYAMAEWFAKECPQRERMLDGVPEVYKSYIVMSGGASEDTAIEHAGIPELDAVAALIARSIDRAQSLVNWIEDHGQSYSSEDEGWFKVCRAAGWLVIQTYFRERVPKKGGE